MNNICSFCGNDMMAGPCTHIHNNFSKPQLRLHETIDYLSGFFAALAPVHHKSDVEIIAEKLSDLERRLAALEK